MAHKQTTSLVAVTALASALSLASPAIASEADDPEGQERTYVKIEASDLGDALNQLARQLGVQIVFFSEATAGKVAKPIDGDFTHAEAIETLLRDTALEYRFLNDQTIAVSAPETASGVSYIQNDAQAPAAQLQETASGGRARGAAADDSAIGGPFDEAPGTLERITVTAQKRAQDLQDVPVSITAFSGDSLARQGIVSLREIARFTPGFAGSTFNETEPILAVRGATNTFSQAGASKPVGVFLDDVFISRNSASAFELFDLEQVAILRGPQGTLFGRNVTGGAIMIQTSRPDPGAFSAKFEASYGNLDAVTLRGSVNLPANDRFAAKISSTYRMRDGYGRDRLADLEQNDVDTFNIRGRFLAQFTDSLDAVLTLDYAENSNNGRTLSTITPAIADDGDIRTSEHGVDQFYDREIFGVAGHVTWELEAGSLVSISAYRRADSIENFAFSTTSFTFLPRFNPFFPFQRIGLTGEEPETFSQELRWVSREDRRVRYILGFYFFDEQISKQSTEIRLGGATGDTIRDRTFDQSVDTTSVAGYTDVEIDLLDDLRLNLGGRLTWEEKQVQVDFIDALNPAADFQSPEFQESWTEFNPRAVLTWRPTATASVYFSFSEGFTSGGFNTEEDTIDVIGRPFDPETVRAFELGAKTEWFDRKLRANLSLFRQKYNDKQEGFLDSAFNFVIVNAAEATIKGVELELSWSVSEALALFGSYSYLDAVYQDFFIPSSMQDRSGNFLSTAPENSFAVGMDYRQPVGNAGEVFGTASFSWQDDYFTGSENRDTFLIDSYGLLNASAGFAFGDGRWRVTVWGKNLTDKEYILIRSDFGPIIGVGEHFGAPRTYGVSVTAEL